MQKQSCYQAWTFHLKSLLPGRGDPGLDSVDEAILRQLKANSRLSMRRLAELVHMTPPAVAERVRRLEDRGIITGYTIQIDRTRVAPVVTAYVDVLMKSNEHARFLVFLLQHANYRLNLALSSTAQED
jgi:DNA-binding Lrp family transcriptional regulator